MADFSERIKELRTSCGYSQQKLADMLNVSKSTVNMYERGERRPGMDQLEAIADYFNVDMDYLSGKSPIPRKTLICNEKAPVNFELYGTSEKDLITKYRKLDVYGQNAVKLIVDAELKRCVEQAKVRSFRAANGSANFEPEIVEDKDLSAIPENDNDKI